MARLRKPHEHDARRNDIVGAALGLVMAKGYERMTIGDILASLGISSGAFYHYFDSRPAVLEALVTRIREESEPALRRVVDDPALSAAAKLQAFFDVLDAMRNERRQGIISLLAVWYSDDNAIVRSKVETATFAWRGSLLTQIVRQGIAEGVFTLAIPELAGDLVMALVHSMGNAHAAAMLAFGRGDVSEAAFAATTVATHAAYLDGIERVLGARSNILRRTDPDTVRGWVSALNPART